MNPEGTSGTGYQTSHKRIILLQRQKRKYGGERVVAATGKGEQCRRLTLIIILEANQGRFSCAHGVTSSMMVIMETTQASVRIA
jgi:hypothetical protein